MPPPARRAFIDSRAARGCALLVFLGCVMLLAYLHRDDLLGGGASGVAGADDPAAPCIAERTADIERMVEEGLIGPDQAATFEARAVAMCRDQFGGGPALPGLPGQ